MSNELESMSPKLSPDEDPKDSDESLSTDLLVQGGIIDESSSEGSDEENEDGVNNGYLPLAQDEGEFSNQQIINTAPVSDQLITQSAESILQHQESTTSSNLLSQPMPKEQVDLIKQVMSGITLPSSSIPDWAKAIPEESWKAELVSTISSKYDNAASNTKQQK